MTGYRDAPGVLRLGEYTMKALRKGWYLISHKLLSTIMLGEMIIECLATLMCD